MPIGPQWRGVDRATDSDEMEESLLRAMDDDPRLASGANSPRADNVLDFIQMTGLTTGRVPDSGAPAELTDAPISFFEYGVRDVDGSGDPAEPAYPDFDASAFHVDTRETIVRESRSISELRRIIADLAEMESQLEDRETPDAPGPSPKPAPVPNLFAGEIKPAVTPNRPAHKAPAPTRDDVELFPANTGRIQTAVETDPTIVLDEAGAGEDVPEIEIDADELYAGGDAESRESPMKSPAGLAAARDLLLELAKANHAAGRADQAFARAPFERDEARRIDSDFSLPPAPTAHHESFDDPTTHQGLRRRRPPSARRWIARGLIIAIAIGAGAVAFVVYDRAVQPPRAAYEAAESLVERGRYEDASSAFLEFTTRFPGNPRRADAMYMAGVALQLVPEEPAPRAKEAYTEAIELLRGFVEAYPAHENAPRAETMMGVLYYKTGRYLEAINILGDPERRLRDPGAYLTALRTLGRSYASVNQVDNARSAFMRAGALESNIAPDQDYAELAGLYTQLAERSGDPAQRRRYFAQAVEQWDFALQVPGLLKSRKDDMKLLRDVAASKAENEFAEASPVGPSPTSLTPLGRFRALIEESPGARGNGPGTGE